LLGEPIIRLGLLAPATALTGSVLVIDGYRLYQLTGQASGLDVALLAALSNAGYRVLGRPLIDRLPTLTVVAHAAASGSAGLPRIKAAISPTARSGTRCDALSGGYDSVLTTLILVARDATGFRGQRAGNASIIRTTEPVVAMLPA